MRIKLEKEILDPATRVRIIQDIEASENRRRKDAAYRRFQCYKDQTNRYVVANLLKQFDMDTVIEMSPAQSRGTKRQRLPFKPLSKS
jgi:hypothetical protein